MTSEALALMRDSRMKKIHTQVGKNKKHSPEHKPAMRVAIMSRAQTTTCVSFSPTSAT